MKTEPCWAAEPRPSFPPLNRDLQVDALIVGGGIAGVTAAYLLAQSGKSVALIEKEHLCYGYTGRTTAHISYPTDEPINGLAKTFGENHAQAAWDACCASAQQIADNVRREELDCEFRHVPGFLYAAGHDLQTETRDLLDQTELAARLGFDVFFTQSCPVTHQPAMGFATMYKFHPVKYVNGLVQRAQAKGALIFEASPAGSFSDDGRSLTCNGHRISFQHILLATNVPLQGNAGTLGAMLLQTKLAAYTTYAIGARVSREAAPEALWWDTSDPYLYLRIDYDDQGAYAILGGEDHKTGQCDDTELPFQRLTAKLHQLFPEAQPDCRWSGQVIETVDGLPYIGEVEGQFVGTGFAGTGMTMGTLTAMMFADHVRGVANPWKDLFRVDRKELSSTWDYLTENKDYPYYLAKGAFEGEKQAAASILCGEGKILRRGTKKIAAYRASDGQLHQRSAVCPHLGCVVAWNAAEETWDCPCHGSRFTPEGDLIAGPAEKGLDSVEG
jgi:glycine/D-amino acid oxidase-like deaminating enzyme/nitrite reductase/ring-hydroxylating ferredoxin subunit